MNLHDRDLKCRCLDGNKNFQKEAYVCLKKKKKGKKWKGSSFAREHRTKPQSYTCKKHVSLPDAREVIPSFQTSAKKIKAIFTLTQITKETKPFSAFICGEVSIEGGFKRTISQAPDHYHCFITSSLLLMLPPSALRLPRGKQQALQLTHDAQLWKHPAGQNSLINAAFSLLLHLWVWQHCTHNLD